MDLQRSPLTLEEQSREAIKSALRRGSPIADALRFAGVPRRTFRTWEKIGREELERLIDAGDPDAEPEPHLAPYVEFVEALESARSEGINILLNRIWDASREIRDPETNEIVQRGTWQAAAWLLERTDPAHFGRRLDMIQEVELRRPKIDEADAVAIFEERINEIIMRRHRVIETSAQELPPVAGE